MSPRRPPAQALCKWCDRRIIQRGGIWVHAHDRQRRCPGGVSTYATPRTR